MIPMADFDTADWIRFAHDPEHQRMLSIVMECLGLDHPSQFHGVSVETLFEKDVLLLLSSQFPFKHISEFRKTCLQPIMDGHFASESETSSLKLPKWCNTESDGQMMSEAAVAVKQADSTLGALKHFLEADPESTRESLELAMMNKIDSMISLLQSRKAEISRHISREFGPCVEALRESEVSLAELRDGLEEDKDKIKDLLTKNMDVSPRDLETVLPLRLDLMRMFGDIRDKQRRFGEIARSAHVRNLGNSCDVAAILGVGVSVEWFEKNLHRCIAIRELEGRSSCANVETDAMDLWQYEDGLAVVEQERDDALMAVAEATRQVSEQSARIQQLHVCMAQLEAQLAQARQELACVVPITEQIAVVVEKMDEIEQSSASRLDSVVRQLRQEQEAGFSRLSQQADGISVKVDTCCGSAGEAKEGIIVALTMLGEEETSLPYVLDAVARAVVGAVRANDKGDSFTRDLHRCCEMLLQRRTYRLKTSGKHSEANEWQAERAIDRRVAPDEACWRSNLQQRVSI